MSGAAEEFADLSHYDLKEEFTLYEAACLIAGVDPHLRNWMQASGTPECSRVQVVMESMQQAYEDACCVFLCAEGDGSNDFFPPWDDPVPPWRSVYDTEVDEEGNPLNNEVPIPLLPNSEMMDLLDKYKITGNKELLRVICDPKTDLFLRHDIVFWLRARRYTHARYFLSNDTPSTPTETAAPPSRKRISRADLFEQESDSTEGEGVPDYLNPQHPRYAPKLAAAVLAWQAYEPQRGKAVKTVLEEWLCDHAADFQMVDAEGKKVNKAIRDVATVANWNMKGGAPRTSGG